MTTLEDAFKAAGVKTGKDWLDEIVSKAVKDANRSFGKAKTLLLGALQNEDPKGIWAAIFAKDLDNRVTELLREYGADEAGQVNSTGQARVSPLVTTPDLTKKKRLHVLSAMAEHCPSPLHWQTELGTVKDLTKEQLNALVGRREREGTVFRHLAQPLPPGGVVKDYWDDEKAASLEDKLKVPA